MTGLVFEGITKTFGAVAALRGLELEIDEGEFMVLVGPSGCGKTTALRVAAGLEGPTGGRVFIGGRDVTGLPPAGRNVAMVFQSYALFPHLTVAENIGFGLAARRVPKVEATEQVLAAAKIVGCEALLERKPSELSGGERQRVALARALARKPDVFLLDEPLSNLDAQLRVDTRAELKRLHQRLRITMLYVTHDQVEALTIGDRVAVLRDGVIQQVGTPDEVYRRPANRFVATFIGSPAMNVLPAAVEGRMLRAGPFRFRKPVGNFEGRRLQAGIRPEDVVVGGDSAGLPGKVQVVEAAGNETFLYLKVGRHEVVARVDARLRPNVGDTLRVGLRREHVYVFDRRSEETLAQARE